MICGKSHITQLFPAQWNHIHTTEHNRADGNVLKRTAHALLGIAAKEQVKYAFFPNSLDPDVGLETRRVVFALGTLRCC